MNKEDLSEEQLRKDREVSERENLEVRCVRGDMADLGQFHDESFDLIFHPVSNVFVPDVRPVWRECHRVLKPQGRLLAGMMNPCLFLFEQDEKGKDAAPAAKYPLPYSEPGSLSGDSRRRWEENRYAAQFSHSLELQLGGQTAAGFAIVGLYEDYWTDEATPLNRFFPTSIDSCGQDGACHHGSERVAGRRVTSGKRSLRAADAEEDSRHLRRTLGAGKPMNPELTLPRVRSSTPWNYVFLKTYIHTPPA